MGIDITNINYVECGLLLARNFFLVGVCDIVCLIYGKIFFLDYIRRNAKEKKNSRKRKQEAEKEVDEGFEYESNDEEEDDDDSENLKRGKFTFASCRLWCFLFIVKCFSHWLCRV